MTPEGMPKGESNMFVYDASPETGKPLTTHQWYDGTQHPWEFKRVWHLEPSLHNPDHVYAGVEDAAIFESTDGGKSWHELAGLRGSDTGPKGSRVQADCVCTRFFSIRRTRNGCSLRFRLQARSAPMTAEKRGVRSITGSIHNTFPIPRQRSVTASIASRCTRHVRARYSCKSTGM